MLVSIIGLSGGMDAVFLLVDVQFWLLTSGILNGASEMVVPAELAALICPA